MKQKTFSDLGLAPFLLKALKEISVFTPTEVQSQCIPPILQGKQVIASAKTGSGKTAAFALPILHDLAKDPYGIFALVLTPTRELGYQIAEQFKLLGDNISVRVAVATGGMDMVEQSLLLAKRPHILVATPGRLIDHLTRAQTPLHLGKLKYLVLDEADRLLSQTYADDLNRLLTDFIPAKRQTLLFSATMTPEIESLAKPETFMFRVHERHDTVKQLEQHYYLVNSHIRKTMLVYVLRKYYEEQPKSSETPSIIIFTGTCRSAEHLALALRFLPDGFRTTSLHSEMTQAQRTSNLMKFRGGIIPIMVATDVASRGLDIPNVSLVIHHDIPANPTDYVHRVGRTARAGRKGQSVALVGEKDLDCWSSCEKALGRAIPELEMDDGQVLAMMEEVEQAYKEAAVQLLEEEFGERRKRNEQKRDAEEELPPAVPTKKSKAVGTKKTKKKE